LIRGTSGKARSTAEAFVPSKLSLIAIEKDGYIRVAATGPIISTDLPSDAPNLFEAVLGANWTTQRVLLDLDRAAYIDSCAIGWLISSHQKLKAAGGSLALHSIRPAVLQLLRLLKVDRVIAIGENPIDAMRILNNQTGAAA
jgi:anti-anti-sigma factor